MVSLAVLALVTVAFVLHTVLHLEPAVVAIVGGLLLLAVSRLDANEVVKDVEWPTLAFFAGLFVMVGALVNTGVIEELSRAAVEATEGRLLVASMVLLWGSAALSAIVDNIPYVATMSPIVAEMVNVGRQRRSRRCCGGRWRWAPTWAATPPRSAPRPTSSCSASPNAPATRSRSGSSPSTAWSSPWSTIALATPYLWLRYFAFS